MLTFIMGAGASASISSKVPVMVNFFKLAAERITYDNKHYWLPFILADMSRLFTKDTNLERLADELVGFNSLAEKFINDKKEIPMELQEFLRDDLSRYKEDLLKWLDNNDANLETVYDEFLSHAMKTGDNDAFLRFRYIINTSLVVQSQENLISFIPVYLPPRNRPIRL